MNNSDSPDDPKQDQDDEMEEGEEGEEESEYCPFFANSDQFNFITNAAYLKLEDSGGDVYDEVVEKSFKHVRPMKARLAVLENPHGSVRLLQGSTSVIAAVYGPSDVKMSKELPHRAAVDVLFRPKVTGTGNIASMLASGMMDPVMEERGMEQTITSVLESVIYLEDNVQAGFNVILHEYENDGCLLSTCINAACVALMNAGCSMRSLFAAVTLAVCGEKIVIDPCASQIENLRKSQSDVSLITFVLTNKHSHKSYSPDILHVSTTGRLSSKTLSMCYRYLTTNDSITSEIFSFFSRTISEDLHNSLSHGMLSTFKSSDDIKGEKMQTEDDEKGDEDEEEEDNENQEEEEDGEIVSDDSNEDL